MSFVNNIYIPTKYIYVSSNELALKWAIRKKNNFATAIKRLLIILLKI